MQKYDICGIIMLEKFGIYEGEMEVSTEFKLYDVDPKDLYINQSKETKKQLREQMYDMAKIRGIKPTARAFNTYPSTVRRILKKFDNNERY